MGGSIAATLRAEGRPTLTTTLRSPSERSTGATGDGRRHERVAPREAIAAIVVVAAIGGAAAGCHPAGWGPADVALAAGTAALVTWATIRAEPWAAVLVVAATSSRPGRSS